MKPHGRIRGVPTWLVDDPRYQGLTSAARHVVLTLWCCEHAGLGRIFRLYPAVLAVQTGYNVETVGQALQELKVGRWIEWDGTVVWVVEALANDTATTASPGVYKSVQGTLAALPPGEIPDAFRRKYVNPAQSQDQTQAQEQTQVQHEEQSEREHEEQSERERQKQNQGSGSGSVSGSGAVSDSVSVGSRGPSHTRSLTDGPPTPSGRSLGAPGVTGEDSPSPPGSAAPLSPNLDARRHDARLPILDRGGPVRRTVPRPDHPPTHRRKTMTRNSPPNTMAVKTISITIRSIRDGAERCVTECAAR